MQKWVHFNPSDLAVDNQEPHLLPDGWQPAVQLRRQPTGFADSLDTAGSEEDDRSDFTWPRSVSDPQPHWLMTSKMQPEEQQLDERARTLSLDALNLDEPSPPPPPPRWSRGSSGDSSDGAWYLDDDSASAKEATSPSTDEDGEEEDSEFMYVPRDPSSSQLELKSIQEILQEGGSSSMYFSSALPSNGRCLYPILEESSDEISDATATEDEDGGDAVFWPANESQGDWELQKNHSEKSSTEEPVNSEKNSRRHSSSSNSNSTSTYSSESSEASVEFEQQVPIQKALQELQQLQTVEDMRRWSLRLQPQQLDAIAEVESAASSSSSSMSSDTDEAADTVGSSSKSGTVEMTAVVKNDTNFPPATVSAQVRVVASSKAQVRDTDGRLTGDEASAVTETTGASVNIAVARAAARAASIATSTVMKNGGGFGRYRILISTQCDVEHHSGAIHAGSDVNDGWCQPLEDSQDHGHSSDNSAQMEHILKLLPALDTNSQATSNKSTHTIVMEEQLLVTSLEPYSPQPESSVESAYIASSGDEGSTSETENGDTTESDNFQTSESDSGAVQWPELQAQAAAYRSVLQQQHPLTDSKPASDPTRSRHSNRLQSDQERLRRAKEACITGQNSLWEQLLDRGNYQSSLSAPTSEPSERKKPRRNSDESRDFDALAASHQLREILDDDLVRKAHQQQRKLLGYRSTDLDKLDDLDSNEKPHSGTVVSLLETQPGQFNSVSLFDLSRSTLECNGLGTSFTPSLIETNIDTGEETYRGVVKETDVDTLQQPILVQSPGSIKRRSRSLLNLTGVVDSKDRESAAEVGVGNAISRSSSKRKSKKSKKERKSFIERLEERAKTDPEKEICRSLSRLRIPVWMDKMPLNGCNSAILENTSRYSWYKAEASRASMSVNDLAVSAALNSTTETAPEETFVDPPVKVEEGYLSPVILPTSVSLPCLLAVRREESSLVIEAAQVTPETHNKSADRKTAPATGKMRSQLFREGQEARRQRLVDLQSRMHRPSLEPVILTPEDFISKASTKQPPRKAKIKWEQPSSARAKALATAAAFIAESSHRTAPQSSASNHEPPPLPPRANTESHSSTYGNASSGGFPVSNSLRLSGDTTDMPPPPPPRSPGAQRLSRKTKAITIPTTAIAGITTKQTNKANHAPPPPPRSPAAQRHSGREKALMESQKDDVPPPLQRRTTAPYLSPHWKETHEPKDLQSQHREADHDSAAVSNRTPQVSRTEQQGKPASPQVQWNRQTNKQEGVGQSPQNPMNSSKFDEASSRRQIHAASPQVDIPYHGNQYSPKLLSNSETTNSGPATNYLSSNSSESFHSFRLDDQVSPLVKASSTQVLGESETNLSVHESSGKASKQSYTSPNRSPSGSDRAVEESTVVQTSVVYRRIVRQTIECSIDESENHRVGSGSEEVEPTILPSVVFCQTDPDVVDAEAQRSLLALVDSQLGQFEESLEELENGGFHRAGNYAEMIAALKAARDESISCVDAAANLFEADAVAPDPDCRRVLFDWLLRRPEAHRRLARLARASHRCLGRGCVLLVFASNGESGARDLQKPPAYVPVDELREAIAVAVSADLIDACTVYNPEEDFVICLAIGGFRLCTRLAVEPKRALTPKPQPRERRQLFVASLQRSLRDRGVSLRHHYPELHDLLEAYVDTGEAFAPVTIRPVDAVSGRSFACSIAVPSAQDGDWWTSEHLLGDRQAASEVQWTSGKRSDAVRERARGRKVVSTEL